MFAKCKLYIIHTKLNVALGFLLSFTLDSFAAWPIRKHKIFPFTFLIGQTIAVCRVNVEESIMHSSTFSNIVGRTI